MKEDASDKPIDSAVLIRMKQFRAMNKLKKLALKVWFNTSIFGDSTQNMKFYLIQLLLS